MSSVHVIIQSLPGTGGFVAKVTVVRVGVRKMLRLHVISDVVLAIVGENRAEATPIGRMPRVLVVP